MITAFTVRNFKAIGDEPVRIELKPITLLFGANSAGKSSIIHALNYAYSVFIDHNLNAEYNDHSDSSLNLGRFERFVHCHSKNRSIILRFDLDFQPATDIPGNILINWSERCVEGYGRELYDISPELDPRKILGNVKKDNVKEDYAAYVEVEISWSHVRNNPYVSRYETGLDNERIATIHTDDNSKKTIICAFNKAHAAFTDFAVEHKFELNWLVNYEFTASSSDKNINIKLIQQEDALPKFTEKLNLESSFWCDFESLIDRGFISYKDSYGRYLHFDTILVSFADFLTSVLVSPGNKVANWLRNTRYLGPLREIPSRYFLGEISGNFNNSRWRWEKGLGAWDELYRIGQIQSDQSEESHKGINDWLKQNFEKNYREILDSIWSNPSHEASYRKYLGDLPDADLFIENGSNVDIHARHDWMIENLKKYLNNLPAETLVSLLPRESLNLKEHADRLLYRINDWLANEQRLNTGYKVFIERYREISSIFFKNFDEEKSKEDLLTLFNKIRNEFERVRVWLHEISRGINLKPHEIGTGISQVLPVVVAAVGTDASLVAIEQPELHIHPAIQVQLGDLFIAHSNRENFLSFDKKFSNDKKFFLIETHSEHLLLRILRRIREHALISVKIFPHEVAIYYVESENGNTQVNRIGLDNNGRFTDRWPKGFFAERMQEMLPSDIRDRVESKQREKK